MTEWLVENWLKIAIPLLVFLATYVIGLWLRREAIDTFGRWIAKTKWVEGRLVAEAIRRHFVYWFLLLAISIAIGISAAPTQAKNITIKATGSLFIVSITWIAVVLSGQLVRMYLSKAKVPQSTTAITLNVIRFSFITIATLTILDFWGVPVGAFLVILVAVIVMGAVALRNIAPNFLAGFQINAAEKIEVGDYIKLSTGEEGYVTEIGWANTYIRAADESMIIIPNIRLLQQTVINYGRPLKKAKEPFRFSSRTHLKELTGLKARNIREMADIMKNVPDAVIYYHTHHFLEEHHFLTPEPSNDFAVWVGDSLGDEVLAEKLASVDTFGFSSLAPLRERLVNIIEEHLMMNPSLREALEGREFHFIKSIGVILPIPNLAHDLREFIEALRKVSTGSLYFHIFESRLRLGRGMNDFSLWLKDSLDETELANEIARLDPYTYTLEGLRSTLIQLIEKRIK